MNIISISNNIHEQAYQRLHDNIQQHKDEGMPSKPISFDNVWRDIKTKYSGKNQPNNPRLRLKQKGKLGDRNVYRFSGVSYKSQWQ